jgi:phosphoenolpyruvate synthase/pyruvate phosphate dikinase
MERRGKGESRAQGVTTIATAFYPKDVIVRLSDFKSNEHANLLGARASEPKEENPMLGVPWRLTLRRPAVSGWRCQFLVYQGIDSISVNPDEVLKTTMETVSQR